ncbi:hypothetical protein [Polaromonas glacialis]|uniref:hypothetical protein n=1 Tax=Polaromonas glacialis TaxID=866564 RepID=UPI0012EC43C3|nr:hypothetical protein [Polaromonas glacialis]
MRLIMDTGVQKSGWHLQETCAGLCGAGQQDLSKTRMMARLHENMAQFKKPRTNPFCP